MIRALLLDLDDTLLDNDIDQFLPAYIQKLARFMADQADPEALVQALLQGTRLMLLNRQADRTLQATFAEHFYPALGVRPEDWRERIQSFYDQEFPKLRAHTAPRPAARDLLQAAQELGLELVIATNPLFPRSAIEQRLGWAGLAPTAFPYALIGSYEDFHFAKPHMEYFAEILARLGIKAHQALMVGDDPANDLAPARRLGIPAFHLHPEPDPAYPGGDLSEAIDWIKEHVAHPPEPVEPNPERLLAHLRGNLAALLGMIGDLPEERCAQRPAKDNWSPREILCHLRDVEREVNLPRLQAFLSQERPFFSAVDSDVWSEERGYAQQPARPALNGFRRARLQTIRLLEGKLGQAWNQPAQHAILGPTHLKELVSIIVEHDLLHLDQLRSALAELE